MFFFTYVPANAISFSWLTDTSPYPFNVCLLRRKRVFIFSRDYKPHRLFLCLHSSQFQHSLQTLQSAPCNQYKCVLSTGLGFSFNAGPVGCIIQPTIAQHADTLNTIPLSWQNEVVDIRYLHNLPPKTKAEIPSQQIIFQLDCHGEKEARN